MRLLIANLPSAFHIVRRFKCSYNAPFFLLPPLELSYLAGIAREKEGVEWMFDDYMLHSNGVQSFLSDINLFNPDIIVTIVGIESIDSDLKILERARELKKNLKIMVLGYLPTLYPEFYLNNYPVDFILMNEPEETFSEVIDLRLRDANPDFGVINGLAFKKNGSMKINSGRKRIKGPDEIPMPERKILLKYPYSEPYFGKPFATMLYSRGCPFTCTYCVTTYGRAVVYHSPERMVRELDYAVNKLKIKYVRFMDDNFTTNRASVISLCKKINEEKIDFKWSCLSRPDTIDGEIVGIMKRAGCRRVYLGIESGSQKTLDFYNKGCKKEEIRNAVKTLKINEMEIFGFLMTGAPNETDQDFGETLEFIKELELDFAVLDLLMTYPGTKLFMEMENEIDFSLKPYCLKYKDPQKKQMLKEREGLFYRSFYLNKKQIFRTLKFFLRTPKDSIQSCFTMASHLLKRKDKAHDKYI